MKAFASKRICSYCKSAGYLILISTYATQEKYAIISTLKKIRPDWNHSVKALRKSENKILHLC